MKAVYNYGAGPAMLPKEVMQRASDELLDWQETGISVMELSHRSEEFMAIAERTEIDLRDLLGIPSDYQVLFLQGGASSQFAMVPLNLMQDEAAADYIHTGTWSGKAIAEGSRFCRVNVAATAEPGGFTTIPMWSEWVLDTDAAYVHYTSNETIQGVQFHWVPEVGEVPLVVDMTSDILSRPVDISRFGVIYASAQKNLGPAGLTVVILRSDLIGSARAGTPCLYQYETHARHGSMYNTPPTFSWYMAGLVLTWLKDKGGLAVMAGCNQRKADKLYRAIDASNLYTNAVDPACRSWSNIPFRLVDEKSERLFLIEANAEGLVALRGHRSVGGIRASIYNAMPEEGVDVLVEFMAEFERRHG
ncbi:MAG: 3-phosphoserine/phosphohydroxythreonine transaminase [Gammaproteobacteria bacterium]|nr:3-phosphoserine/phosphohydroxythreonine transaminase [Gammaproteobacteria bacterium]MCI0590402.1 3-phosphoserine/phosphohydroxythreonine transaminase [Gammaproteobacteria bacterium]